MERAYDEDAWSGDKSEDKEKENTVAPLVEQSIHPDMTDDELEIDKEEDTDDGCTAHAVTYP
jgi:hypothetical protein